MFATYVDSSALLKLVVVERESGPLRDYLQPRPALVTSALTRLECLRALKDEGEHASVILDNVLSRLDRIKVSDRILDAANHLVPRGIRVLDAIHLATALRLEADLDCIVSYDDQLLRVAGGLRLNTASPGRNLPLDRTFHGKPEPPAVNQTHLR
jgi:predicted nucleic acid-binding protein